MSAKVVVRKVRGGKLFRLRLDPSAKGRQVVLEGDFFLYPEDSLERVEAHLWHCFEMKTEQGALRYLRSKLDEESIQIIGADAADLISALWEVKE